MAHPTTVGARELKTRLGRYLQRVRQGETLIVTDHGEPAAELRPIAQAGNSTKARLDRLVALGIVSRLEARRLGPFQPIRNTGTALSSVISNEREDRF